jgi:hypothetical protein
MTTERPFGTKRSVAPTALGDFRGSRTQRLRAGLTYGAPTALGGQGEDGDVKSPLQEKKQERPASEGQPYKSGRLSPACGYDRTKKEGVW